MKKIIELKQYDIDQSLSQMNSFCRRWISSRIDENQVQNYLQMDDDTTIDYYVTLFICYNHIYNSVCTDLLKKCYSRIDKIKASQAIKNLIEKNCKNVNGPGDGYQAHTLMFSILKHEGSFQESIESEIKKVSSFFKSEDGLFVKKQGDSLRYKSSLDSEDSDRRLFGILVLLYNIRCNIFHGNKEYQYESIQIVKPLTLILFKIVSHFLNVYSTGSKPKLLSLIDKNLSISITTLTDLNPDGSKGVDCIQME